MTLPIRNKLLIAGGRDYGEPDEDDPHKPYMAERIFLRDVLDQVLKSYGVTAVIHGKARGADKWGGVWCQARKLQEWSFPAQWKMEGKGAGPIRNDRMNDASNPDIVVAFPGGRGTEDMVSLVRGKVHLIEIV